MPTTIRKSWSYPAKGQYPFYDVFSALVRSIDSSVYARQEDNNLVLTGGGTITWTLSTGALDWTADIILVNPYTGFTLTLEPPSVGTFLLNANGWIFYAQVTRANGSNLILTPQRSTSLPKSDDAFLIAIRLDDSIWFRNGVVFHDGDSGGIGTEPGTGIEGWTRIQSTVVTNGDTWVGVGAPATAATQGALSAGFSTAILAPGSVDVFYNNALCHFTSGAPGSVNEWRWVTTSSPAPVIEIGTGSLAGDIVTVKHPR